MKCPKCRHVLEAEYDYCPYCGEPLEKDTSFSPDDYGERFVQKADGSVATDEAGGNRLNVNKKNSETTSDKKVMKTSAFVMTCCITALFAVFGAILPQLLLFEIFVLAMGISMTKKGKYDKKQLVAGIIFIVAAVVCGIIGGYQLSLYFASQG